MNQTFRKTDYSKLFFIRTRLIFPMCLIYTPVTETLLKEILMKKEEEFLRIVSQSIYVQGLSREWSGFAQRWWKSSCPESLSQGFVTLSDLYRALQRKFVICLFPLETLSCPSFLIHCWRNLGSSCLPESFPDCVALPMPLPWSTVPAGSSSEQQMPLGFGCWDDPASQPQQLLYGQFRNPVNIWCSPGPSKLCFHSCCSNENLAWDL